MVGLGGPKRPSKKVAIAYAAQVNSGFPLAGLDAQDITSEADASYNCIGWALDDWTRHWWPDGDSYWPPMVPFDDSLASFVSMFRGQGFTECNSSDLEPGFVRIALYTKQGIVTHAARQREDGSWSSKLGRRNVDVRHKTLQSIEGALYGTVAIYMKKPK